jgi:hypothetical protein
MEAWKIGLSTGQFVTFQQLPGWDRINWCLLLPKNWRSMNNKSLAEIAYFQWSQSNKEIIKNLSMLKCNDWISLEYDTFLEDPLMSLSEIISFCNIESNLEPISKKLGLSKTTVSKPDSNKWLNNKAEMETLFNQMQSDYKDILGFCS